MNRDALHPPRAENAKVSFRVPSTDRDPDFPVGMLIIGFFMGLASGVLLVTLLRPV